MGGRQHDSTAHLPAQVLFAVLICLVLAGCGNVYLRGEALTAAETSTMDAFQAVQRADSGPATPGWEKAYLRRLMAGDLDVVAELDGRLSNDEFIVKVKANTARWENVANYNKVREDLKNELLLRLAPIVLALLAGLVGL